MVANRNKHNVTLNSSSAVVISSKLCSMSFKKMPREVMANFFFQKSMLGTAPDKEIWSPSSEIPNTRANTEEFITNLRPWIVIEQAFVLKLLTSHQHIFSRRQPQLRASKFPNPKAQTTSFCSSDSFLTIQHHQEGVHLVCRVWCSWAEWFVVPEISSSVGGKSALLGMSLSRSCGCSLDITSTTSACRYFSFFSIGNKFHDFPISLCDYRKKTWQSVIFMVRISTKKMNGITCCQCI